MGFEPQTAGQPLVNVHKRTTKVNFAIVISVVVFIAVGIFAAVWAAHHAKHGDPTSESPGATR